MNIAVIGDVHSRETWKDVVKKVVVDKIIFLGDYCDPYLYEFDETPDVIKVLREIIQFKKDHPSQVILLLGNHDTWYIYDVERGSRFDRDKYKELNKLFKDNLDLFQYAYKVDNHLFTHAGVSSGWLKRWRKILDTGGLKEDLSNIDEVLNKAGKTSATVGIINNVGAERGGRAEGGITWADRSETIYNQLPGIHQYVGHTQIEKVTRVEAKHEMNSSITYCDCLGISKQPLDKRFLILDI